MPESVDYNEIMSDRKAFNEFVYTPMSEALRLLDERRKDPELMKKVEGLLKGDIPEILKNKKCGVLARQVATPNHETRMFIKLAQENDLFPVLFEFHDDKFTAQNEFKHSLAQLHIPQKVGEKNGSTVEKLTIIDFNKHGSKKISEVKTLWDEPLTDFHKKLFHLHKYNMEEIHFYDMSDWLKKNGVNAVKYYTNLFLLFTCHGILFENFLMSKEDNSDFTKNIVLPAMEKVVDLTGVKPLITPVGPLDIETDGLWYQHLPVVKDILINLNNHHGYSHRGM